jgi:hypothetical protein
MVVFHVSEDPGIREFVPRPSRHTKYPVVWAVNSEKLRNYLLPRECPRVTYYAGPDTTAADAQRLLGASSAVVAIESSWWDRINSCRLYCYHLPADTFECIDECAGYFVSRETLRPLRVDVIDDAIGALLARRVELRMVPELYSLRDAVVTSTLQFSIIRMKGEALP